MKPILIGACAPAPPTAAAAQMAANVLTHFMLFLPLFEPGNSTRHQS